MKVKKERESIRSMMACNPKVCSASGRGLQPSRVRVKDVADFKVFTKGAGRGQLKVTVKGPQGLEEPVKVCGEGDSVYECHYCPNLAGKYTINITWGGHSIPCSPFEVVVGEEDGPQKFRALGPGLETGMVGKSADFVVEAIGTEERTLSFAIEGPSEAKIECVDMGDGSCDVRYWPTEAGDYAVHVTCDDEDIKDSPFMAHILNAAYDVFPEKVKCYGPGLESTGCIVSKPAHFTIDTNGAGRGELRIYAQDDEGFPVDIQITDNGDSTFSCVYTSCKLVKHTIIITWGEVNVPNSPFRVAIREESHPENVKVYGPGVEKAGLKANEPTYFTVDCSEAGHGGLSIGIKCASGVLGPAEADIDFDIIKNDNDTFTAKYKPPGPGLYTITVLFADQEIPVSPFTIRVDPSRDAATIRAEGPGVSKTEIEDSKRRQHQLGQELRSQHPVLVGQVKKLTAQFEQSQSELEKIRQRQTETDKKLASLSLDVTQKATIKEQQQQQKVIRGQQDQISNVTDAVQKMQSELEKIRQTQTEADERQTSLSLDVTQHTTKEMEGRKRQQKVNQDLQDQVQKLTVGMKEMQSELEKMKRASGTLNLTDGEAAKKLKSVRDQFIEKISTSTLHSLLDKLLAKSVITDDEMEAAMGEKLRADKARHVIDLVRRKGNEASSEMIGMIHQLDRNLSDLLQLKPPPTD